jgi:Protein of unknown function (DUF3175)
MAAKKTKKKTKNSPVRRTPRARKESPASKARPASKPGRWSSRVTRSSDALDLESGVFKLKSPLAVARSLKKSAERSGRRKSTPFRSAMSMLNFEINRGGRNLTPERQRVLNAAKQELRKLFKRPDL